MSFSSNAYPQSSVGSPYDAETPVNLRAQTLRRRPPEPEPDDDTTDDATDTASVTTEAVADDPGADPTEAAKIEVVRPAPVGPGDAPTVLLGPPVRATAPAVVDEDYRQQVLRAELLAANPGIETDPAEWGRRGRINATLGMKLRPEPAEIDYRYDVELISRAVLPPWFVVMIANPKGGQGKTPTTLMVSYIFGLFRGAGVVAWDNTESKGTLADRAEATTPGEQLHVWDLLEHASELAGPNAQAGALGAYLRRQPITMVDVLASDSSSKRDKAIGTAECDAVAAVLRRHRHGVFVDTAGEDLSENWQWTAHNAHQLVIPMTYRRDAARAVLEMLDGLRSRHGRPDLVTGAVVALAATPGSADPADRDAIITDLNDMGITRIIDVPYEPLFEGSGTRIAEAQLSAPTHIAYTRVAAEIADQLSQVRATAPIEYTAGAVPHSITRPASYTGPLPSAAPMGHVQQMAAAPQWTPGSQPYGPLGPPPPPGTSHHNPHQPITSYPPQGGNS
ncbi:ParA family protein [Williamsia sp. DF01-3]|uniref:MinD/ParA family ATP-binding protein n=1 Tax=Williamsia sp. DF01-3 TaxID=2934157 RepID=UPI000DB5ABA1|nr:ParA family protein [Williamsia sp. DF01-3]MCK0515760.1 ParA family protein [Williamsia sp. DF01-3]PZU02013.1 MAG: hypothetical protein DI630_10055 [Gordonia sp. (in: high G+C Gram-positive bacteria)]